MTSPVTETFSSFPRVPHSGLKSSWYSFGGMYSHPPVGRVFPWRQNGRFESYQPKKDFSFGFNFSFYMLKPGYYIEGAVLAYVRNEGHHCALLAFYCQNGGNSERSMGSIFIFLQGVMERHRCLDWPVLGQPWCHQSHNSGHQVEENSVLTLQHPTK